MDLFNEIFEKTFLHNSVLEWLGAVALVLAIYLVGLYVRRLIRSSYQHSIQAERPEIVKVSLKTVGQTTALFIFIVAIFAASTTLEMSHKMSVFVKSALIMVLFWQIGVWISTAVLAWLESARTVSKAQGLGVVEFMVGGVIWLMVVLLMLDNLGVNITSLIAGLGIGGVAVALAVQNVLGDLLASISITLDKPFVIGDFLVLDNFLGSVEHIGIKSTRLRSLSGEQIIIANTDLLKSRLRNYGRMLERRVVFQLLITYETPRDKLERIPGIVRAIIDGQADTRFDRCHFANFGHSSLEYEAVYYVLSADYNRYMDIQQEINFRIYDAFDQENIKFAYPTQKLLLESSFNR